MKKDRLQRILKLLSILQAESDRNPDDLARRLDVSKRTFFRDLRTLVEIGFNYQYDTSRGCYKVENPVIRAPLELQLTEALAVLLTIRESGQNGALPLIQEALTGSGKIEAALPDYMKHFFGSVFHRISFGAYPRRKHGTIKEVFLKTLHALHHKRKIWVLYDSGGKKQEITISPYHLHFADHTWYLIGDSSLHRRIQMFNLHHIRQARIESQLYVEEQSFHLPTFLGNAWSCKREGKNYAVQLIFSKEVADHVANLNWHPTQKLSWRPDGSLGFEARVDGLSEIAAWILSYGDKVRVVGPESLKRHIRSVVEKMSQIYQPAADRSETSTRPEASRKELMQSP